MIVRASYAKQMSTHVTKATVNQVLTHASNTYMSGLLVPRQNVALPAGCILPLALPRISVYTAVLETLALDREWSPVQRRPGLGVARL